MDKQCEKIYDCLILDMIRKNSDINISVVAKELSCMRSFVMNRLEYLLDEEYITALEGNFYLTDKGEKQCISIETVSHTVDRVIYNESQLFDWSTPFVPSVDVFEK